MSLFSRVGDTKHQNVPPLTTILSSSTRDGWLSFYFVHEPQPAIGVVSTIYRAAPAPCQTLYRIFDNKLVYNTLSNQFILSLLRFLFQKIISSFHSSTRISQIWNYNSLYNQVFRIRIFIDKGGFYFIRIDKKEAIVAINDFRRDISTNEIWNVFIAL